MAVAKVVGLETEYGIHVNSADSNATSASSLLINAYVAELSGRVGWDFEDESPGNDARGFIRDAAIAPEIEMHLVNTVLTNGARLYVDHAHPEYSTPECSNAREVLVADRAGEVVMQRAMVAAARVLGRDDEIVIYKNNSDGKRNSYGTHENYLLDREVPFARIAHEVTAHLVTRQIYTGSGKVGCEEEQSERRGFEISQRADFFEEQVGLETTLKRPIINTRDEPHADAKRYRRLHVITGDANLAEVANFLKVGVTSLVLILVEEEVLTPHELVLANPLRAMHDISHDLALSKTYELVSGRSLTAIELQWELYDLARKYAEERGLDAMGAPAVGRELLERWEQVLIGLESNPSSLSKQLDWVAKYELIDAYCARHNCEVTDHRVAALDLQYHDLRPEKSLQRRLQMETIGSAEEVEAAVTDPPTTTRAYFRGECLKRYKDAVTAANWDSIVFDLGEDPLRRVPMMDPLRGSKAHVGTLLDECATPAELIKRLGG